MRTSIAGPTPARAIADRVSANVHEATSRNPARATVPRIQSAAAVQLSLI